MHLATRARTGAECAPVLSGDGRATRRVCARIARLGVLAGACLAVVAAMLAPSAMASTSAPASTRAAVAARSDHVHAKAASPARPYYQLHAVEARVKCGGFNGNVQWGSIAPLRKYIEIWGEVWDTCGGYTYVYLSWNNPTHHNQAVAAALPHHTDGFSPHTYYGRLGVSNIAVTVCSTYGTWHCGRPVRM